MEDDYTKETFPYDEDTLNNDDMLEEDEEEEENEDDEKLADQEHRWEADNDR